MSTYINPLVEKKIESMDIDENMKKILEEIIDIEASHGNNANVKKVKIKSFRDAITKRMPR
ncbi:MAG: hypothetical protein M0Q19_08285 [Candidatus Cloacimonetes bacterium]|nr:hypothetical protein [Candidatus Cloacimonadota bacterium]MCK9333161.1 hypothetical protein [Candidatus Cloacimonadota bacterium]